MNYHTFEPGAELSLFVKCYWTLEDERADVAVKQRIVPDGCIEMIFHYGDLYKQYLPDGTSIVQPRCFVIGQLTQPLQIEPAGATGIFSVRFHPGGFMPFASIPLKEMENRAVAMETLYGKEGKEIAAEVLGAKSTHDRIKHIEAFLNTKLTDARNFDQVVKSTVDTIITANGQLSVYELSQEIKNSRRSLERRFAASIGLSPKQLSRIIRLQATLKMLLDDRYTTLSALSHEQEYYDQAHFIKDFKEFTGVTPKEFYHDQLRMSSFFSRLG